MSSVEQARDKDPSVGDSIAATLQAYGVRFAFGIPGNDVLELIRACEAHGIQFVLAGSEPQAAFMADAVCQVTGKPAVFILALGPGIANAVSGVAGALMERSPVIVLGGEMASHQSGIYSHQVFDHVSVMAPVTKWAAVLNPARAAQQTAKALDIATTYPAGPVYLNCPADLGRLPNKEKAIPVPARFASTIIDDKAVTDARDRLIKAQKPVALIGCGALHEQSDGTIRQFLEAWKMPFFSTYKAKGIVDEKHQLSLGSVGLSPVVDNFSLEILREADLIALIGFDPIELRDAWIDPWPASTPCLTIDRGPQVHRILPVGEQLIGDVSAILLQLIPSEARSATWPRARLEVFRGHVMDIVAPREARHGISPAALFAAVDARCQSDWWLTVDVGAHRILANHSIRCRRPGQLLQSNGLGCMGYAIPAAIGARLADPKAKVVAMLGDGCALMSVGELNVAVERDLPLVIVILNDSALSLIKLKQNKMKLERRAVDFRSPEFHSIARGFGANGLRVNEIGEFEDAFDTALTSKTLTVIEAMVDPSEYWGQM